MGNSFSDSVCYLVWAAVMSNSFSDSVSYLVWAAVMSNSFSDRLLYFLLQCKYLLVLLDLRFTYTIQHYTSHTK